MMSSLSPSPTIAGPSPRPPRILYICSSWPHGQTFGGQLRALHVGRALQTIGRVTVLVVSSEANDPEARARTAVEFEVVPPIVPVVTGNRWLTTKLRRAFDTNYMNVHGYAAEPADRARLDALIREFDLVWVLNSRTPNILQRWSWPHAHLDLDDVPSTYLRTIARSAPRFLARAKARVQRQLLHRRERLFTQRFTTLSVCSAEDRNYLSAGSQLHVIPNGFQRPATPPARALQPECPRVGFIGLYSYAPNVDGVRWFLKDCWPRIRETIPHIRFRLIGKDTDGPLKPTDSAVDALGWVADPAAEIATWSAMIIPIHFGGGTRIKIAEAFSRKCPAASTTLGAFGYDVKHGQEIMLADTPRDFASACIDLVRDPERANAMAERAWTAFLEKWTWEAIMPKVAAAAADCLSRSRSKS